jgi:sphingosine kinase
MTTTSPLLESDIENNSNPTERILFEDIRSKVYYGVHLVYLQFTTHSLVLSDAKYSRAANFTDLKVLATLSHSDLIGCSYRCLERAKPNKPQSNTIYQFSLYYYPVKKGWLSSCCGSSETSPKQRKRKEISLFCYNIDEITLENWKNLIYCLVYKEIPIEFSAPSSTAAVTSSASASASSISSTSRSLTSTHNAPQLITSISQKSFLIFVNPVSGKRKALKIYKKIIEPMLIESGIKVDCIETQYAFHAKEYVNTATNLLEYTAILTVGGDGILQEVFNGILSRSDGLSILEQLPIQPMPGGTGNGLSKSILFTINEDKEPLNAVFNVIKGKSSLFDLSRVTTGTTEMKVTHYAFLMLSWGLISDIDIHSETLRFLGELRIYLYAVYYILARKLYYGKIKMKLLNKPTITDEKILKKGKVTINKLNPSDQVLEDNWINIEGEFMIVAILQSTHLAGSVYFGPGIQLNDGCFTVYLAQSLSRLQMINILLSADAGEHIYCKGLRIFQCTEYMLEPDLIKSPDGIYSLDGEVINYGPVHGEVMPGAARVRVIQN